MNINECFFFQWNILCDDAKKYVPLTKTIFYAGKLFGAYFFGWVSDRFGRRVTLLITMLVQFIASLIESFSVNFVMYVVLRVPLGICSGGEISKRQIEIQENSKYFTPQKIILHSLLCDMLYFCVKFNVELSFHDIKIISL